jgi:DNA-binding NarL/FixJ family response regulator
MLRGQYPQIPVVMVSAQEEASVMVKSREFGASGFIPKSSDLSVIQEAVRKVLDGDVSGHRRRSKRSVCPPKPKPPAKALPA